MYSTAVEILGFYLVISRTTEKSSCYSSGKIPSAVGFSALGAADFFSRLPSALKQGFGGISIERDRYRPVLAVDVGLERDAFVVRFDAPVQHQDRQRVVEGDRLRRTVRDQRVDFCAAPPRRARE